MGMPYRLKLLPHIAANALRVAIWRAQLGMFRLQMQELLQEAVELRVGHFWRVERIVLIGGSRKLLVELGGTCCGRCRCLRGIV